MKAQKNYYLREKMKAIRDEIGGDNSEDELDILEEKIRKSKVPKELRDKAE